MKLFQDLPSFALERIVRKLSFFDKANVLIASTLNMKLNSRLNSLCKMKRPKICPLCILNVGTNFEKDTYIRYTEDLHNQLLNCSSGDSNWVWEQEENIFSINDTSDDYEYSTGYFSLGGQWNYDLQFILNKKGSYHRKILLQHFKSLYNYEDFVLYDTNNTLLSHIVSCHAKCLSLHGPIFNIQSLKTHMNKAFSSDNLVLNLGNKNYPLSKNKIYSDIHFVTLSTYYNVIESLENSMSIILERESSQSYFNAQVVLIIDIAQFTIKKLRYKFGKTRNDKSLIQIRRLLKMYSILSSILGCVTNFE